MREMPGPLVHDHENEGAGLWPTPSSDAPSLSWDEELATLLGESAPVHEPWTPSPAVPDGTPAPVPEAPAPMSSAEGPPAAERPHGTAGGSSAAHRPARNHRRAAPRRRALSLLRTGSLLIAALTAVVVSMVSVYGGMVAYAPLLRSAAGSGTPAGVVRWWPLLVYGPWLVASLSIIRAAFHRRRALHSWAAVLLFSAIATALCVAQAPRTPLDAAAAALPAVAALACFQQLVRQITLTRPPLRSAPRHRDAPTPSRPGPPGRSPTAR
ncbi:DUF2637 domain-containing protein [Streptomyces lavendulocolor]|uniref:DUF2637 domain-containing protein n=1 Tax=Streptomyces lavendulocolor TaxID=67316 RepID=UPI003C2B955D